MILKLQEFFGPPGSSDLTGMLLYHTYLFGSMNSCVSVQGISLVCFVFQSVKTVGLEDYHSLC